MRQKIHYTLELHDQAFHFQVIEERSLILGKEARVTVQDTGVTVQDIHPVSPGYTRGLSGLFCFIDYIF